MDIKAEERSYIREAIILDMNEIEYAYYGTDRFEPGIKDPTMINFKSGESLKIQIPYREFVQIWKKLKNGTGGNTNNDDRADQQLPQPGW